MSETTGDHRVEAGPTTPDRELPSFAFFTKLDRFKSGKWHGRFMRHGTHATCDALIYAGSGFPIKGEMDLNEDGGHERWRIEQTSDGINFKLSEESDHTMLSSHVAAPEQRCYGTDIRLVFKHPLVSVKSQITQANVDFDKSEANGLQSGTIRDVVRDLVETATAMQKAS